MTTPASVLATPPSAHAVPPTTTAQQTPDQSSIQPTQGALSSRLTTKTRQTAVMLQMMWPG